MLPAKINYMYKFKQPSFDWWN